MGIQDHLLNWWDFTDEKPNLPPGFQYSPGSPGAIMPSGPDPFILEGDLNDWDLTTMTKKPKPQPAPGPSAPPSFSGGSGSLGDYSGIYTAPLTRPYDQTFQQPSDVNLGGPSQIPWIPQTPSFNGPSYKAPPPFQAPSYEDVQNDPGYKFASDEGIRGLQQSAAARGVLNSGGTLKDVAKWAGDYASQRYNDVYNRKLTDYGTNYLTQYTDPYRFAYQAAFDAFQPQMTAYSTQAAAGQRAQENNYQNAYTRFLDDYKRFADWQDRTFNKTTTLGLA